MKITVSSVSKSIDSDHINISVIWYWTSMNIKFLEPITTFHWSFWKLAFGISHHFNHTCVHKYCLNILIYCTFWTILINIFYRSLQFLFFPSLFPFPYFIGVFCILEKGEEDPPFPPFEPITRYAKGDATFHDISKSKYHRKTPIICS